MIVTVLGAVSSCFFQTALFWSHIHFLAALLLLNVHVVAHHFWFVFILNHVRPFLAWSPL